MLLPDKYVQLGSSLLGQAAQLLQLRSRDQAVNELWGAVKRADLGITYDRFILSLDLLHSLGLVEARRGLLVWRDGS